MLSDFPPFFFFFSFSSSFVGVKIGNSVWLLLKFELEVILRVG